MGHEGWGVIIRFSLQEDLEVVPDAVHRVVRTFLLLVLISPAIPASAQQTGTIAGKVLDSGGAVLPGVTVEARSSVLPAPRVATTEGNGDLPATRARARNLHADVRALRHADGHANRRGAARAGDVVDATLGVAGVTEAVTVTATASLIERDSASLKSGVSNEQIMSLPVGQEYRDLLKLIPGVQYTQDATRGPSAGGSGQDNVYLFDGANVTLPLFGTLSAEPASHDIAQVTTIRGGARAIDFDRSGGFMIDSVSKSGANRYRGEISWQFQNHGMAAELNNKTPSRFEQDRTWFTGNVGGPIIANRIHFYASYYRPENERLNQAN